jgi:prepilin-type N-terminal cleavage/methylation domain-containing protein
MISGRKIEIAPREKSLAVDWHDCSWSPAITVQSPVAVAGRLIKPLLSSLPVLHTDRHNPTFLKTMKTTSLSPRRLRAGFTLVELLVVIAIIGILAGMSLAVIPRVMDSGRKAKAKLEAQGIVTAIEHYDSIYGRFPVSSGTQAAAGTGDFTYGGSLFQSQVVPSVPTYSIYTTNNSEVIAILMNLTNYPDGSGATANLNYQKNPQKTIFLNAKRTDDNTLPGVGTDLVYRDPWGNPYVITMDLNYDEQCNDAFYTRSLVSNPTGANTNPGINGLVDPNNTANNFQYHGKVMVWSAGVDKKIDPGVPANQGVNKDNVTSW